MRRNNKLTFVLKEGKKELNCENILSILIHLELNTVKINYYEREKIVQKFLIKFINFLILSSIKIIHLFRSSNIFFSQSMFLRVHLRRNYFRESLSENRDPRISRRLALSVAFHLTDETDICDRTDSSRVRLRFGSDYGMRVCTCITARLASQCFKAKCRRSLISTKTKLFFRFSACLFNRRACPCAK